MTKRIVKEPTVTDGPKEAHPECGSSDGLQWYRPKDPDSTSPRSWFCFACRASGREAEVAQEGSLNAPQDVSSKETTSGTYEAPDRPYRGLSADTLRVYKVVKTEQDIAFRYATFVKFRDLDTKKFAVSKGHDLSLDKDSKDGNLFGKELFPAGGKIITVTEGEIDAMSLYQCFGQHYPVVSIPNGAPSAAKDCQAAFEYLNSFEQITLMFDADTPGQEAAAQVAMMFPGKVKVARLDPALKDANGYLTANKREELVKAFWNAQPYRPNEIVNGSELLDTLLAPNTPSLITWQYPELEEMTDGLRPGEICVMTAGTGIGKSSFARETVDYVRQTRPDLKIGMLMLEESKTVTVKRQVAVRLKKRIYRKEVEVSEAELKQAFDSLFADGRFEVYSQLKVTSPDAILGRIEYMIRALGCRLVVLDHLSFVMSGSESDDERKEIDLFMTKLRALTEATQAAVLLISHLTKQSGQDSHEEGGRVRLSQLRGSGAIAQLSDIIIALERDPQGNSSKDPVMAAGNTIVRVLKNRWVGDLGPACITRYNRTTGVSEYVGPLNNSADEPL